MAVKAGWASVGGDPYRCLDAATFSTVVLTSSAVAGGVELIFRIVF